MSPRTWFLDQIRRGRRL